MTHAAVSSARCTALKAGISPENVAARRSARFCHREPLEAFAARFDDLFACMMHHRSFHADLPGLLLPRDRNKTLTAHVGLDPILQAQNAAVQQRDGSWQSAAGMQQHMVRHA
jgi:hypothetical protein